MSEIPQASGSPEHTSRRPLGDKLTRGLGSLRLHELKMHLGIDPSTLEYIRDSLESTNYRYLLRHDRGTAYVGNLRNFTDLDRHKYVFPNLDYARLTRGLQGETHSLKRGEHIMLDSGLRSRGDFKSPADFSQMICRLRVGRNGPHYAFVPKLPRDIEPEPYELMAEGLHELLSATPEMMTESDDMIQMRLDEAQADWDKATAIRPSPSNLTELIERWSVGRERNTRQDHNDQVE